jgi:glycyl-tRNA synthetase alpha subunit
LLAGDKLLPLPAYDQCIKASHAFNLLQARGVISVQERASYIGRVRDLANFWSNWADKRIFALARARLIELEARGEAA